MPRLGATVGSYGVTVSYERGIPVTVHLHAMAMSMRTEIPAVNASRRMDRARQKSNPGEFYHKYFVGLSIQ